MSMMRTSDRVRLGKSQSGVVSLLVTMVLMIVISLIALGFAQVAQRNQGQQLDQQLSDQAFYAAESGVNDAAQIISTQLAAGTPAVDLNKPTCASDGVTHLYDTLSPALGNNVDYTCILVNPYPPAIETDIGASSKIVPISATTPISKLTFKWSSPAAGGNPVSGCPNAVELPPISAWGSCGLGILRIDLVPTDTAPTNSAILENETLTTFVVPMRPGSGGATNSIPYPLVNASTTNRDNLVGVDCSNTAPNCTFTITTSGHTSYDLRVISEYQDSSLQITASDAGGNPLPLAGAQAIIDATGKDQNVVRRIQVYVPLGVMNNQLSDYAMETTDSICKRFSVMSNYYLGTSNPAGVTANNPTLDPLCN